MYEESVNYCVIVNFVVSRDNIIKSSSREFLKNSIESKYSYNFKWMGRPVIQYPQDIVAVQELIWDVKPDLIIETGVLMAGQQYFLHRSLNLML